MRKLSVEELGRKSKEEIRNAEKFPIILVLENIRSAYNVGSILRTADAFQVCAIYTTGYTAHPPHIQISKTALGADETVNTRHYRDCAEAIEELKRTGYQVYAAEQAESSISLSGMGDNYQPNQKIAIVLGNEVSGVEQETINRCDGCIEIPQGGMKHSLNVSVVAGIVVWELVRMILKNNRSFNK